MERLTYKMEDIFCDMGMKYLPSVSECNYFDILNKLGELEDMIEQGYLHIFPCKKGDSIFLVDYEEGLYDEGTVEKIYVDVEGICVDSDYEIGTCVDSDYVFFSEEAARKAIRDYRKSE